MNSLTNIFLYGRIGKGKRIDSLKIRNLILVRLMGGLGNQMFQYAFGKELAFRNKTELKLDLSLLHQHGLPDEIMTHRDYDLDIFNIKDYSIASSEEIFYFNGDSAASKASKVKRKLKTIFKKPNLILQENNQFKMEYLNIKDNSCLVGRWQSENYFPSVADQIRKQFTFKEKFDKEIIELGEEIAKATSVCIHIRRGDLLTSPIYSKTIGSLENEYYEKALNVISEKIKEPELYVFSDDVEWCNNNLKFSVPFRVVSDHFSGKKSSGHLFLMAQCKHFIISNSTFAWWAAWMANYPHKMVVAPKNWFKDETLKNPVLFPQSWIAI